MPECRGWQLRKIAAERACWEWWDDFPRGDLKLVAATIKRVLDFGDDRLVIGDREGMMAALERIKAYRERRPIGGDRASIDHKSHTNRESSIADLHRPSRLPWVGVIPT